MANTKRILALILCLGMLFSASAWAEELKFETAWNADVATEKSLLTGDAPLDTDLAAENAEETQPEAVGDPNAAQPDAKGVKIDKAHFPDKTFRKYVKQFDTDGNGSLSNAEISAVTEIDCSSRGIASLKGIEYFGELEMLFCQKNKLKSLDVSKNTKLVGMGCYQNKLTSLDISKNTNLVGMGCDDNQITRLDVSHNKKLETLWCHGNKLRNLDLSQNKRLEKLWCYGNKLTSLDISKCSKLVKYVKQGKREEGESEGRAWVRYSFSDDEELKVAPNVKLYTDAVKKVTITNGRKVTLRKGKKLRLKVAFTPETSTSELTWTSSNEKVATVSATGKVTAKRKGTAKITVRTTNGKKATIAITVK